MEHISFSGLLIVATAAFVAPLALGLVPKLRLPAVVLEILLGIVIGPSGLGWVKIDTAIEVVSLLGLAFLLFLAGLEIDLSRLRGRALKIAAGGYALSLVIAIVVALGLHAAGLGKTPMLIAIILASTALGVVIPLLKDGGEIASEYGQLVVASASIADFGAIILLTLFFSGEHSDTSTKLILLGALFALAVVIVFALREAEMSNRLSGALRRLQDTTAQIRVRGAFVLLAGFAALAENLGLEVILGAFIAGAILTLVDKDEAMTHPDFRKKLEGAGFGIFIPVYFVTIGINFDLDALFASASTVAAVPVFLAALLVVRGLPALLYVPTVGRQRAFIAALLQATSLPFIVAASQIGMDLNLIKPATGAGLVAAGLLSVMIFPLVASTLLGRRKRAGMAHGGEEPERAAGPLCTSAM